MHADDQSRFHLIALGECLAEMSRRPDGAFTAGFAGDAFNTLFYASRLGLHTGFVSAVGTDLFTSMIVDGIEREGIDTRFLARIEDRRNGLYFIDLADDGEYTFHYWRAGSAATQTLLTHNLDALVEYVAGAGMLLLSGITLAVMEGHELIAQLLREVHGRTRVVLDTNYRARLWASPDAYRARIEALLPSIDIFLPSAADLRAVYPGTPLEGVCATCAARGVGTIVVKDGANGCAVFEHGVLRWIRPEAVVQPVDTTGAGDAFNAGLLAGLCRGASLDDACALGNRTARQALMVHGAIDRAFDGNRVSEA